MTPQCEPTESAEDGAKRIRDCLDALGASRDVLISIADATGCYELRISDIRALLSALSEIARLRTTIEGQALTLQGSSAALAMVTKERDAKHKALQVAVNMLFPYEPGDSRDVSDIFVALAATVCGQWDDAIAAVIEAALNASAGEKP
jgi:hypothetical protein